jgi:hypothetical protein
MPASSTNRNFFAVLATFAVLASFGCQSIRKPTVFSRLAPGKSKEIEFVQPHRMAVIWTEDSLPAMNGKKGTRGFGGRVYFYDAQDKPVRVDGELNVYAYDDSSIDDRNAIEANRKPDRKYVFLASEFQKRHSESGIGPSYNVFIPWDEVGGPRKTVSLVPIFKPTNGQLVGSGHAIAMLRGKTEGDNEKIAEFANQVRQTSAVIPGNVQGNVANAGFDSADSMPQRRTTTINLPRSLGKQLNSGAQMPNNFAPPDAVNRQADSVHSPADNRTMENPVPESPYFSPETGSDARNKEARNSKAPVFGSPGPVR